MTNSPHPAAAKGLEMEDYEFDTSEYVTLPPNVWQERIAELEAENKRLREVEKHAREVMRLLHFHGEGIVDHLLDDDDNAGERLREALQTKEGE